MTATLTHLERLEAESIHIMREAVAQSENPVMLYSVGKDSAVMLHLARKAFYPSKLPFPLLHVDTTWKFREMYKLRDSTAAAGDLDLIVHTNPDCVKQGINPVHSRQRCPYRHVEDRRPQTSPRSLQVRRCIRRRPP